MVMETCERTKAERDATLSVIAFVEKDLGELPVRVVAGALLRAAVALAAEVFGPGPGATASRQALENILEQQTERKLQ